jgi:hypothetical protein
MPFHTRTSAVTTHLEINAVPIYEINISEPYLKELINKLELYEKDEEMIRQFTTVKEAWDQYQLALNLCQNYHTK